MANEAQRTAWTDVSGPTWVRNAATVDRMLGAISDALLASITAEPGARVLDVGCGTGTFTAAVAALGTDPVGVDISSTMIEGARARFPDLTFVLADAQVDPLPGPFDAVVSRFGVMFFDDPVAAFANIGANCVAGATLDFVCWRSIEHNPVFAIGTRRLLAALPSSAPADPLAPGPLAFADDARLRALLIDSGWSAIDIRPLEATCRFDVGDSDGIDERVEMILSSDSGRRFRAEVPAERQAEAIAAARADLESYIVDGHVEIPGGCWLVRARR